MKKSTIIKSTFGLGILALLNACSVNVPKDFAENGKDVNIYPDYTNIEIPCNLAPTNFEVLGDADKVVVNISGKGDEKITVSAKGNNGISIPIDQWKKMLAENVGGDIHFDIYAQKDGKWEHYKTFNQQVSSDSIDSYLTYRLIEPSYSGSGFMGIYQFNLSTGEETAMFTNHRDRIDGSNQMQKCLNCHTAQRNHPENKMFYYRSPKGGLMLTYKGKLQKINTRTGDMFAGTVYPSWHPTLPFIAFSSNSIKQGFNSYDPCKIDPFDEYSDLVLYDIEKNEITAIRKTYDKQETNPCWSGDGQYLYYNCTDTVYTKTYNPRSMLYDIFRIKFNAKDKSWSEPELVYCATKQHKSATYPKVSPDSHYLLFTQANFGTSTQTNKSADLYLTDLKTGTTRALNEVNCPTESDSYHDWSSDSKWIVFCSRREDGNYARPFFAHLNADGKFSKPFIIPREDPEHHHNLLKCYNVTEFSSTPIKLKKTEIQDAIDEDAVKATYGSPIDPHMADAYSGASQVK